MKSLRKMMALVIACVMIIAMAVPALAAVDSGTYTIQVKNGNPAVSINGKTFKAYKLFDVTYVEKVTDASGAVTDQTTLYGNDTTPHSYTLSTSSTFYTTDAAKAIIEKYFTLTAIEGDTTKVVVTPKMKDTSGKNPWETGYDAEHLSTNSCFTEVEAYELSQALNPYMTGTPNASAVASEEVATIDVSNNGDAGYYLVTGEGNPKKEDGTVDTSKTVTAAVALTTTDPKAAIVAKVDGVTNEKKIDEGNNLGKLEADDVKEDNHAVGDKVPFIVKSKVPNMTGYEKYYFIFNDTLSKGLTFNDDLEIKFVDSTGAVKKTLAAGEDYTLTTTGGNGSDTAIEVVFKNFIQYKGTLVTASNLEALTGGTDKTLIGTYWGTYEDCDIIITYSANVNEYAVIGDLGNPNTSKITFSNKPDQTDEGQPGNPDKPKNPEVTGETPESTTKTYVTGLKVLKYTGADKKPLADAKFEFTGTKLNKLVEKDTKYFRAITTGETGTYYLLKDGTYTQTAPVTVDNPATTNINEITLDSYVKTWEGDTPTPGYVQDTMKTFSLAGATPNVKVTATTDAEGLLTFTGLAAGEYVLEETEAPAGYNKLKDKIYITVSAGTTESDNDVTTHTWTIKYKLGEEGTEQTLTSAEAAANLFELDVENQSGTELPSTGGIGTTIFYIVGACIVIGAGVLLVTRRRMNAQ